jgi:hypothetical protein
MGLVSMISGRLTEVGEAAKPSFFADLNLETRYSPLRRPGGTNTASPRSSESRCLILRLRLTGAK